MSLTVATTAKPCPYCGSYHSTICPRVEEIEYHQDGSVKRVRLRGLDTPADSQDCEHDYVYVSRSEDYYRCDKCDQTSKDGVYPRVGSEYALAESRAVVLALVNVAKAAEKTYPNDCGDEGCLHASCHLSRALAALNKETTK